MKHTACNHRWPQSEGGRGGVWGGVLDRRHVLDLMHGRSRMTIDPRIPKMPGRSMSGLHRPEADITCTKREAKREVSGESQEG